MCCGEPGQACGVWRGGRCATGRVQASRSLGLHTEKAPGGDFGNCKVSWACARLDSLLLSRCRHAAAVLGCAGTAAGARRTTTTPPLPRRCPAALPSSWWCSPPGGTPTTWASPGWRWLMQCGGRCPPTPPSSWQVGGWVLLGIAGGMGRGDHRDGTGRAGTWRSRLVLRRSSAVLCTAGVPAAANLRPWPHACHPAHCTHPIPQSQPAWRCCRAWPATRARPTSWWTATTAARPCTAGWPR